jgi:hypothetical protein
MDYEIKIEGYQQAPGRQKIIHTFDLAASKPLIIDLNCTNTDWSQ